MLIRKWERNFDKQVGIADNGKETDKWVRIVEMGKKLGQVGRYTLEKMSRAHVRFQSLEYKHFKEMIEQLHRLNCSDDIIINV